jgi:hypothetical protein
MNAKWRGDHNRAFVRLIKAELQVYLNFEMICSEFHEFAMSDCELLSAAASGQKFIWRRKDNAATATSAVTNNAPIHAVPIRISVNE